MRKNERYFRHNIYAFSFDICPTMKISVVIPVYNAERYVESAVDSALHQKETAEILLVEDNSPDNALVVCEKLSHEHPRVRLIRHRDGKNHGAGESRNLGIREAQYDHVAFLDADDYYLKNCFSKAVEVFNDDPTVDGVYAAVGVEFENEEAKRRYFLTHYEEIATVDEKVTPKELFRFLVLGGAGYIHLNGLVVKKAGLLKVGLLPKLRLHQDSVLTIKLAAALKLVAGEIHTPVSLRRIHLENRITDLKTNFSETNFRAAQYLLRWSKEQNLSVEKKRIIRGYYWAHGFRYYRKAKKYPLDPRAIYYFAVSRLFGNGYRT